MMCKQACSLEATVIGTSLRPSFWHARNVDKPNSEIYANRLGWAPSWLPCQEPGLCCKVHQDQHQLAWSIWPCSDVRYGAMAAEGSANQYTGCSQHASPCGE